jgi:NAD(P)-dependent dehydrogenase (short-subunit alcohol dehydrogenase family)
MTTNKKHTMLIVGATDIVGVAAINHFACLPDWQVIAVSRRVPELPDGVSHLAFDLTDAPASVAASPPLRQVAHVLFLALIELLELIAGWRDSRQMTVNLAILRDRQAIRHANRCGRTYRIGNADAGSRGDLATHRRQISFAAAKSGGADR